MSYSTGNHNDDDRERTAAVAAGSPTAPTPQTSPRSGVQDRQRMLDAEKETFGGIKFFTAFFGWLTATGTVVLLTALATGISAAAGLGNNITAVTTGKNAATTGIVGSILLAVIILIGYYAGGYVAGRMARFSGLKQGLAVWLWLVLITIVLAVVGAIVGSSFNVFAQLGSIPNLGNLTGTGAIAAAVAAILALIGALLGGLAGMHYHRKVDKAGLEA
jgi:hypothetical protein